MLRKPAGLGVGYGCKDQWQESREDNRMGRATVQDVAKTAGVSVGTVSRVLNQSPAVSESSKEKVNAAIRELNYRPLASARDLRRDRTMRILALAKNLNSPIISEAFRGVGDAAASSGYVSLIAPTAGDLVREDQLVDMLRNGSVDGLILFSPTMPDEDVNDLAEQLSVIQVCEIRLRGGVRRLHRRPAGRRRYHPAPHCIGRPPAGNDRQQGGPIRPVA
jgi:hypothetical protein